MDSNPNNINHCPHNANTNTNNLGVGAGVVAMETTTASSSNPSVNDHYNKIHLARMNNTGANALEYGETKDAISFFTQALQASKELELSRTGREGNDGNSASSSKSVDDAMTKFDGCCCKVRATTTTSINSSNSSIYQDLNVYCQPIRLPEDEEDEGDDEALLLLSDIECAAVIIFNLALAYQLLCTRDHVDDAIMVGLRKSTKFYEMAYKLMNDPTSFSSRSSTSTKTTSWFFLTSTVNNMAVAFQQMNEIAKSSRLFQHLLSMIMLLQGSGLGGYLSLSTYGNGFLQNVTPYMFCDDSTTSQLVYYAPPAPAA